MIAYKPLKTLKKMKLHELGKIRKYFQNIFSDAGFDATIELLYWILIVALSLGLIATLLQMSTSNH